MLAAQSIAGDDGALEVILGLGVMLTFTPAGRAAVTRTSQGFASSVASGR
jgi:hypothetical protein